MSDGPMPRPRPPLRLRRRSLLVAVLGAATASAVGGCAGAIPDPPAGPGVAGPSGSTAPVTDGAAQVHVDLVGNACTLDFAAAQAGPVTFTVTNTSATGLTEVELMSDERIIAEKENLAPGLPAVSFTLTLGGGTYQIYCPGADTEQLPFTVIGEAAEPAGGSVQDLLRQGASDYGTYVATQIAGMQVGVQALRSAVDGGDVAASKIAYAKARAFYEKIESDVAGFVRPGGEATDNADNLDYLIDMRASNLDPAVGWHGFHAIERDLWQAGTITAGTKVLAAELVTNVGTLVGLSKDLRFAPEDLANGAAGLLEEVQSSKIKGTEEAFSHLDLLDFAANVEGAQQAFANLKPGLTTIDPALTDDIVAQFAAVVKLLDGYRDPAVPGGYAYYTAQVRTRDAATLSKAVQALQDPLSRIAQKVATAR